MSEEILEYTQEDVEEAVQMLEKTVLEVEWSRDSELTDEQIDLLLDGKRDEVEMNAFDNARNYIYDMEWQAKEEIAKEYGIPIEELEDCWPATDLNFGRVVGNTVAYLAVPLLGLDREPLEHLPNGYGTEYEDHEDELEALGVNPHLMYEEWPDMPERDDPILDPDELYELWNNLAFYHSVYMVLLDGDDVLEEAYKHGKVTSNIVKKGAMVTLHDYINGASSVEAWTRKDVKIDPKDIVNDGGNHYGIQSCCGLYRGAWNGQLVKEDK